MENETEPLVKKQELDLLESAIFMAPKLLAAAEENKETLELETPRQCYVCKTDFTKMHHFTTQCVLIVVILIMQNVFKLLMWAGCCHYGFTTKNRLSYYTDVASVEQRLSLPFSVDSALRFGKEPDFMDWGSFKNSRS
jgi:hypothetical protein